MGYVQYRSSRRTGQDGAVIPCMLGNFHLPVVRDLGCTVVFLPLPRSLAIKTLGAGGGSIAWIDTGGALQVGPQSAGAVPGPVCYCRGGTEPTVSDADVVLG